MADAPGRAADGRRPKTALLRYVLAWTVAGTLLAGTALLLLGGDGDDGDGDVRLPPVAQIDFMRAAGAAGCDLRSGDPPGDGLPTDGPPAPAAVPAVYVEPVRASALVGAMRLGVVVFHVRPGASEQLRDELRRLQLAVPRGTIVTPNPAMPSALAATAWQRSLACPRPTRQAIDAIRLFRGRFLGTGPESP